MTTVSTWNRTDPTPAPRPQPTSDWAHRALVVASLLLLLALVITGFVLADPPAAQHGPAHGLPGGSVGLSYHHRG